MSQDLAEILTRAISTAKYAWWTNYEHGRDTGDQNRTAVALLAKALFERATADLEPRDLRDFLAEVEVKKR